MNIKSLLWLSPFICFTLGYWSARSYLHKPHVIIPSLIGKPLLEAFALLSQHQLSPRLLDQKIDPDLPEGTVISQIPHPGQAVKQRHTVFLVVSQHPPTPRAPDLVGKFAQELSRHACHIKQFQVESAYPSNQCIGHYPRAQEPMREKHIICYVADTRPKPILWPNFVGLPVTQVQEFLESYGITPHITGHIAKRSRVVEQRPLAGSIITLYPDQLPYVQLRIQ